MRKNGFTLIELLAVIVILAIIALIATPIILGIINDAREESNERSVELYASAVRNGIAAYQLREGKEVLPDTYTSTNPLPFEVEYDGKVDCENVIISEDGKVSLDKCTVNGGTKKYSYGIEEEPSVAKACTIEKQDTSKYSIGDEVTCNIGESPDKFYVIADAELTATTLQMLTEKNIHTTEYRQSDNAGKIVFSSTPYWKSSVNDYPADVYSEENDKVKLIVDQYVSYLNGGLTEDATGSLITFSKVKNLGCDYSKQTCGPDMGYGKLESSVPKWVYSTDYWIATASGNLEDEALFVVYKDGSFYIAPYWDTAGYNSQSNIGVRPVITISINDIQ